MRKSKNGTEELVGRIGVDAGIVMVGDPCYHLHKTEAELKSRGFAGDWAGFAELTLVGGDAVPVGLMEPSRSACAMVIGGFHGDGIFPVYIKRDQEGAVSELIVRFER